MVTEASASPATITPSFVKMKELLMPGHMFLISIRVVFSAVAYGSSLMAGHPRGLGDLE